QLSKDLNLPNWNKHSSSCLATRIATDQKISQEKVDLIKRCENVLQDFGFMGCRVRISNDSAIIELLAEDIERFAQEAIRQQVWNKFNDFNILNVCLSVASRKGILF
ncbi:MAG: hypothetical protein OEL85_01110, partial [Desulfobulbaceae bacterium]|nr:hypothetical protein [Desulfobulbaceae bacterium]